jgi:hypothetical protein
MRLKRGDVVLCRLPLPSTGLTQYKLRPAVVVSKALTRSGSADIYSGRVARFRHSDVVAHKLSHREPSTDT